MHQIKSNGIQVHYTEQGSGPPLLLIMGITAPGSGWEKHAAFWQNDFRCLMPDNRGVGQSDKPAGPYHSGMMAEDLAGVIDQVAGGPVRVVGCSMGSIIAQQLALRHPTKIKSMVLMCPWARCDRYAVGIFEHMMTLKARLRPEEFVHYLQLLIFAKKTWDSGASHSELLQTRKDVAIAPEHQPLHALEAQAAACINHNVLGELGRITCPTLVIGGVADLFTPPWMAHEVAEAIPGCELHLYPEAGHAFHWERLGDFNPRVRDWLLAH